MKIKEVSARAIKDSRNEKTIEVSVNGQKASAPEGKSTGKYETRIYRTSLKQSIKDINTLTIPFDINSFSDLAKLESFLVKTFKLKNPQDLGANPLFALEAAILKALAKSKNKQLWQIINPRAKKLPRPVGNAIGGGRHSSQFKKHPSIQEFLLIPKGKSFKEQNKIMREAYKQIGALLKTKKTNDEGAWQTSLNDTQVLQLLQPFRKNVDLGLDIAASSSRKNRNPQEISELIKTYKLFYVEDPLKENAFDSFAKIHHDKKTLITGDDLTATHMNRLKKAARLKSINAMIVKPNQNGSLISLQKIIQFCKKHNIKTILSHRSGETLDTTIADLAVGFQTDFIKTGIATKWREAKLKRLLQIERQIS